MKRNTVRSAIDLIAAITVFLILATLAIWWEYSVWTECRAFGHSWFYCLKLLGAH